ncbi:MAG: hypothetical protein ACLT3Y_10185 [Ruminococcus callidus]
MEAESDGEQLREQLRLHLEDKRILNGDAGKRLRRDFGRLLKSGEERVPMADIDYEIYKYINELADQYIELDDLLEQNGVSYTKQGNTISETVLCLLEKLLSAIRIWLSLLGLNGTHRAAAEHPDLQYLYFCVVTDLVCECSQRRRPHGGTEDPQLFPPAERTAGIDRLFSGTV